MGTYGHGEGDAARVQCERYVGKAAALMDVVEVH